MRGGPSVRPRLRRQPDARRSPRVGHLRVVSLIQSSVPLLLHQRRGHQRNRRGKLPQRCDEAAEARPGCSYVTKDVFVTCSGGTAAPSRRAKNASSTAGMPLSGNLPLSLGWACIVATTAFGHGACGAPDRQRGFRGMTWSAPFHERLQGRIESLQGLGEELRRVGAFSARVELLDRIDAVAQKRRNGCIVPGIGREPDPRCNMAHEVRFEPRHADARRSGSRSR